MFTEMNDSTAKGRWYTAILVVSSEVVPRDSDTTPRRDAAGVLDVAGTYLKAQFDLK
jgi:hypothetical protein